MNKFANIMNTRFVCPKCGKNTGHALVPGEWSLGVLDILIGKVAVALIGKIVSKKLFRCSNCSEYFEQRDVLVIKLIMFLLALIFFIVPIAISVSYYLIHEYIKI